MTLGLLAFGPIALGASLAIAAIILAPVALIDAPSRTPSAGAVATAVVLGLVCTALSRTRPRR